MIKNTCENSTMDSKCKTFLQTFPLIKLDLDCLSKRQAFAYENKLLAAETKNKVLLKKIALTKFKGNVLQLQVDLI